MILVLRFAGIPLDNLIDKSTSMALLCYGTTVGFSIIVSGDILRKLFSDKKEAMDKMEILNNVLALVLFTVVGVTRVDYYNKRFITTGEIYDKKSHDIRMFLFKDLETIWLLVSWQSS